MNTLSLNQRLRLALIEDGAFSDVTSQFLPHIDQVAMKGRFQAKAAGVVCGVHLLQQIFEVLDPKARVIIKKNDGQIVHKGDVIAVIHGRGHALLAGERVALNLLTHLSGIASETRAFCNAVKGHPVSILETRKTTPLWRDLEKYAVVCGGGKNHRLSLSDAILVKDNHQAYLSRHHISVSHAYSMEALQKIRKKLKFVAVEATNYKEVWEAIKIRADIILLDNMPVNQIKGAMVFIRAARKALNLKTPLAEVSGGVTLKNIKQYAALGIDRISIGALTHSAPALDISMEVN